MAKKKLTDIAEEFGITFEEANDLVFKHLEEEWVTGKGRNTWISLSGQAVLDDLIRMPTIHRGLVMSNAPNISYIMVAVKGMGKKVPVKVPRKMQGKLVGKFVYMEAIPQSNGQVKYFWIKPPKA